MRIKETPKGKWVPCVRVRMKVVQGWTGSPIGKVDRYNKNDILCAI